MSGRGEMSIIRESMKTMKTKADEGSPEERRRDEIMKAGESGVGFAAIETEQQQRLFETSKVSTERASIIE